MKEPDSKIGNNNNNIKRNLRSPNTNSNKDSYQSSLSLSLSLSESSSPDFSVEVVSSKPKSKQLKSTQQSNSNKRKLNSGKNIKKKSERSTSTDTSTTTHNPPDNNGNNDGDYDNRDDNEDEEHADNDDDDEDDEEDASDDSSNEQQNHKKKKTRKRIPGNYKCDFPGCLKIFSRSEHLSRHKLNHNPKTIYRCHWADCNKTFVRNDLLQRHLKRHDAKLAKFGKSKNSKNYLNNNINYNMSNNPIHSLSQSIVNKSLISNSNSPIDSPLNSSISSISSNNKNNNQQFRENIISVDEILKRSSQQQQQQQQQQQNIANSNNNHSHSASLASNNNSNTHMHSQNLSNGLNSSNKNSYNVENTNNNNINSNNNDNNGSYKFDNFSSGDNILSWLFSDNNNENDDILMKSSNFNSTTVPPDITEYRITNNDNNFFIPEGLDISPKSMMSLIREIEAEQQLQQQQPQQQSQQQSQQQTQQQQVQQQQTVQAAQAAQATPTAAATISPQLQQKLHQQQQSNILLPQQQYSPNGFPQQHFPPQSLFHKEMNSIDDQLYYNDIESNNNTNTYTNKINSGISTYQSPSLNSMQTPYFTSTTSTNMSNMSNLNTFNNANGNSGHNNMNIPESTGSLFQSTNPSSDLNLNLDQSTINYQTTSLNNYKLSDILKLIPSLINHPDFKISKLERLLSIYWNFFHVRFPILHKPTFIAKNSPTLLLLAMIMLGAKLSNCVPDLSSSIEEKLTNPKTLADQIANPLRWLLFSSPHFQPPAKSWIIQSLLILEFYEKNCSSRVLHERAHLHHGTTIQLLRRSPTLGGSPLKSSTADDANTSSTRGNNGGNTRSSGERLLQQWIEAESMKRATFMCFYMDAIDSISFGHQILIYAHQLQLTMPCEDELWENYSLIKNGAGSIYYSKPPPFLLALKNILNGIPTKVNSLGKKVLVAGICAIMYQIQQRDLQIAYGLDKFGINASVGNWRELLTAAFAIWRNDVGHSCCSSKTAVENLPEYLTFFSAANNNNSMDDDNVVISNSSPSNGDNGLMMGDRMNMGTQRNGDGGGISGNRNNNRGGGGGNNNNNRSNSMAATSQFSQSDTRCKCITYHMAHVFMSISHYDFTTFAGAPWRMSVRPTTKTRQEISKRIKDWCRTPHAKLCVVQCYLLLFEMFLSPQDSSYELDYTYNPDQDLFFRSNVIGLCTLVLWCFNYCTYGKERDDVVNDHGAESGNADQPEQVNIVKTEDLGVFSLLDGNNNINSDSNIKENTDKIAGSNSNLIPPAEEEVGEGEGEAGAEAEDSTSEKRGKDEGIESGYEYLRRIRKQFTDLTGGVMLHTWYETVSGSDFYMRLMKYVQVVELIKDQKNMVGLCNMIGKMMIETNYSLSKEIAKLILFCASRSNGNTETVLENMYDE